VGNPQHRLLLRGEGDVVDDDARAGDREEGLKAGAGGYRRFGLDAVVVPSLLLLIARDLFVLDPPRVLAWRLLHDPRLTSLPSWLAWLLPRPLPEVDRDPIALGLATAATVFAAAYLAAALAGSAARVRLALISAAAAALVVAPTLGFMAMGHVLDRPYGQDGGVVQLPLALDKILAGESPYGADYSKTILAKEAGASKFWASRGGNPILRHHAYLPGTHLLAMPFHVAARAIGAGFDPRVLTLVAYVLAAWLASLLMADPGARLSAAACVLLNPLAYWHQIFGANDIVFAAMILGTAVLLRRDRPAAAAALLGLACATKQLAWPFAPFLLIVAAGAHWPMGEDVRAAAVRLARLSAIALGVFAVVVLPVAALDFRAFYADIVGYNVGLPGADNYPLGGTPGFGFANVLIYGGAVRSLGDYFPFGIFYLLLVPLGLLLLRTTARRPGPGIALAAGAAALLASLYFSRVVHPNYVAPLAVLLPVAVLAASLSADVVVIPLALAAVAVEIAELSPLRLLWDDAVAVRWPAHVPGAMAALLPRSGPELTEDPLSLLWSAIAAGFAAAYLAAAVNGASARGRSAIAVAAIVCVVLVPAWVVVAIGDRTGVVRAQDEWVPDVRTRLLGSGGATAREAWRTSFREEPARLLGTDVPHGGDPRLLSMLAVAAAAIGLVRRRSLLLGALLIPPAVTSVVFGGPHVVGLAALLIGIALGPKFRWAPLVAVLMWAAFTLVPSLSRALDIGAGYGFVNLCTYHGHRPGMIVWLAFGAAIVAPLIVIVRRHRLAATAPVWAAALLATAVLLILPSASPDAVLVPLALLAIGVTMDDSKEPT